MATADFIVIGAGMSGASVASELAEHGSVVLVEREERPGYHSTGRSAAAFIPSYGVEMTPLRVLTAASLSFFDSQAFGHLELPLLTRRGLITIGETLSSPLAKVERERINHAISGVVTELCGHDTRARLPRLRASWSECAWWEPDVFDIDVDAAHQYFLRRIKSLGGTLFCTSTVHALTYRDALWRVQVADAEFSAPVVVNAAGAWSQAIGTLAGVTALTLTPMRRTAICFTPPDDIDTGSFPLVLDHGGSFYMKPDAGQLLVSPADEHVSPACDAQPEELDIAYAIHNMQQAFDIDVQRVNHSWAGLRTFAPDRQPVIGFDQSRAGFFWLAGHGGHGIQIAPAAARAACGLITRGQLPEDLVDLGLLETDISPSRFLDSPTRLISTHC